MRSTLISLVLVLQGCDSVPPEIVTDQPCGPGVWDVELHADGTVECKPRF